MLALVSRLSTAFSGSRGTRTHKRDGLATCFQDRALIQPDDFRDCERAGASHRLFGPSLAGGAGG